MGPWPQAKGHVRRFCMLYYSSGSIKLRLNTTSSMYSTGGFPGAHDQEQVRRRFNIFKGTFFRAHRSLMSILRNKLSSGGTQIHRLFG